MDKVPDKKQHIAEQLDDQEDWEILWENTGVIFVIIPDLHIDCDCELMYE